MPRGVGVRLPPSPPFPNAARVPSVPSLYPHCGIGYISLPACMGGNPMRYFLRFGAALRLLAALAVGAGCGGDGSPEPTRRPTATAEERDRTPKPDAAEGGTASEAPEVPRTPAAGADFLIRLESMLDRYRDASFKVTARAVEFGEVHDVVIVQLGPSRWEQFEGFQPIIRKQQSHIRKGDEYFTCTIQDRVCRRGTTRIGRVSPCRNRHVRLERGNL